MLDRAAQTQVTEALRRFPVVAVVGPRQCGKSTLAKALVRNVEGVYVDLELPSDRAKLLDPEVYFERHATKLVCLDEIHHVPEIFAVLRGVVDQNRRPGRFLVLGSASIDLLMQATESLAGRIAIIELTPFLVGEVAGPGVDPSVHEKLWLRGGYPESFLAADDATSLDWRRHFSATLVQRDVAMLGTGIPPSHIDRCWRMLAHWHGQLWNAQSMARNLDMTGPTARRYLDILCGTFLVRTLEPLHVNLKKRLVKSPKIYYRDSGLLHAVLGITDFEGLLAHPALGASFEGFCVEQILARKPRDFDATFYRSHTGDEIDLVLSPPSKNPLAVEFKYSSAPTIRPGLPRAMADVGADRAIIVHAGRESFPLSKSIEAMPLGAFLEFLTPSPERPI